MVEFYIARKLCKKWDDRKQSKIEDSTNNDIPKCETSSNLSDNLTLAERKSISIDNYGQGEPNANNLQENTETGDNKNDRPVFCRKCGVRLLNDSHFCNKCGTKVIRR